MTKEFEIQIVDDSGLLSLVDCSAYESYLSEDWDYEGTLSLFVKQMAKKSILVWDCRDGGGSYTIKVRNKITAESGFKETIGSIKATENSLHLVSYDSLTMAAQYSDEKLPSKHEQEFIIPVSEGIYKIRLVQMHNPEKTFEQPLFLLEYELGDSPIWSSVAWQMV